MTDENLASVAHEEYDTNLTNIVYMGMGERFSTTQTLLRAFRKYVELLV